MPDRLSASARAGLLGVAGLLVLFFSLAEREWRSANEAEAAGRGRTIRILGPDDIPFEEGPGTADPAPGTRSTSPDAPAAPAGFYVVQPGDTLGAISKRLYGKASRWKTLYAANRDVVSDPHRLEVGVTLRVP